MRQWKGLHPNLSRDEGTRGKKARVPADPKIAFGHGQMLPRSYLDLERLERQPHEQVLKAVDYKSGSSLLYFPRSELPVSRRYRSFLLVQFVSEYVGIAGLPGFSLSPLPSEDSSERSAHVLLSHPTSLS